jgi:hypothetical protein
MDIEMSGLLARLLASKKVAVIGGGKYMLFKQQLLATLQCPKELLKNLFLFPTTSTAFYRYRGGWKVVYEHVLSKRTRARIVRAFSDVFRDVDYRHPQKTYGKIVEDRGTQVTFSALGQDIVTVLGKKRGVALKDAWRRKYTPVKMNMARLLAKRLPDLEVHAAGYTSIDVTQKGIDKAYGVRQIQKHLNIPIRNMVFVGDALFPGGNDYAARRTGISCVAVRNPEDTKRFIRFLIGV